MRSRQVSDAPLYRVWSRRLAAFFLLVCVGLTGCADDDDDDNPVGAGGNDIIEVLSQDSRFDTLVTAIEAAGLTATLQGDGPFTVFAPHDSAFRNLPAGLLDSLLADPPGDLETILLYHVASDSLPAAEVLQRTMIGTVQGDSISVTIQNGAVLLNLTTVVTETDIQAANGVIHALDGVLIPPSL
jgi:uncharacterized surface protein with fasciclin (FAS1) repeats